MLDMSADADVLSELVKRLPAIRRWIDGVLARSLPLATRVDQLGFSRLSAFFSAETLRRAYVLDVDHVPTPPLVSLGLSAFADFERLDVDGITYQDLYFVRYGQTLNEALHFHELVHVVQWELLGAERFILAYALGHALYGYANNPLENMAYALQARFENNDPPFSVEPLVRHGLKSILHALFGTAAG